MNNGLVHYYFGSVESLLVRVLERFTERLIARQRAMYADPDVPFAEKWRTAMRYLDADASSTRRSGTSCRRFPGTGPSSASRSAA